MGAWYSRPFRRPRGQRDEPSSLGDHGTDGDVFSTFFVSRNWRRKTSRPIYGTPMTPWPRAAFGLPTEVWLRLFCLEDGRLGMLRGTTGIVVDRHGTAGVPVGRTGEVDAAYVVGLLRNGSSGADSSTTLPTHRGHPWAAKLKDPAEDQGCDSTATRRRDMAARIVPHRGWPQTSAGRVISCSANSEAMRYTNCIGWTLMNSSIRGPNEPASNF